MAYSITVEDVSIVSSL